MKSKRTKATDIPQKVKQAVWERDGGRCVVCGCCRNVMPNAHFIPRSKGGLGIEENIVTLCTNLTENQCHYKPSRLGCRTYPPFCSCRYSEEGVEGQK